MGNIKLGSTKIVNTASKAPLLCQRNLKYCPQRLEKLAYSSLVRSTLDNCASIWDPCLAAEKRMLETIQGIVTREYHRTTSVAGLLSIIHSQTTSGSLSNSIILR